MSARLVARVAVAMAATLALAGCVVAPPSGHLAQYDEVQEHWDDVPESVVGDATIMMTFTDLPAADDDAAWDALLSLELEAGDALMAAGMGYLDGNGSDGVVYDVFFMGPDHEAMWQVIEPIYDDAPIAWSTVSMWASDDDAEPAVELTQ